MTSIQWTWRHGRRVPTWHVLQAAARGRWETCSPAFHSRSLPVGSYPSFLRLTACNSPAPGGARAGAPHTRREETDTQRRTTQDSRLPHVPNSRGSSSRGESIFRKERLPLVAWRWWCGAGVVCACAAGGSGLGSRGSNLAGVVLLGSPVATPRTSAGDAPRSRGTRCAHATRQAGRGLGGGGRSRAVMMAAVISNHCSGAEAMMRR